ncbi:hypothetical protein IWW37_001358 [Coemansia sp. RSA 2050]|nr:hypothetical protein IWW37_001358 [Coemansia sp. RSA 2050]
MANPNSEKRAYLEPAPPSSSNPQPEPAHLAYPGSTSQEDPHASSSSRVPPAYSDLERGLNNNGGGSATAAYPPNAYPPASYQPPPMSPPPMSPPPMSSPPYDGPYHVQQPQQPSLRPSEPICLTLLNPRMVSSGFSMVMPESLHRLAPRPVDPAKWTLFMQELNDALRKAPGTITKEISDFWLVHVVTLGMAGHARNMLQSKAEGKAAVIVEKFNRAEFAAWGIRVHFDVVSMVDDGSGQSVVIVGQAGGRRGEERRQRRDDRRSTAPINTLELVIERA